MGVLISTQNMIGTQKKIYIMSKRKAYNTPKLGQTKNRVGMSQDWLEMNWGGTGLSHVVARSSLGGLATLYPFFGS